MSKPNKVNKDSYVQRGRLTPDDMARERMHQAQVSGRARTKERVIGRSAKNGAPASSRSRNGRGE